MTNDFPYEVRKSSDHWPDGSYTVYRPIWVKDSVFVAFANDKETAKKIAQALNEAEGL